MNKDDVMRVRDEIIHSALPQIAFDGWAWPMIERAAEEAGHSASVARAVFPDRMKDVLDAFADLADREMIKALSDVSAEDLRIRDRIREALIKRYEWLGPHKEAVRQSVQFWMVPTRKPRAAKLVWRTADRIWDWAEDEATDYNCYTKRGLLSGIIVSTTLFWLNEKSEDLDNTKSFLDRRIEDVMKFGKVINKFKKAS